MPNINLSEEDIQKLVECIEDGTEVTEDLLPKLSPGFFEKLRAAGKFNYKELDKYKIPTLEYAGKRSEAVILAQAALTGGAAPLQVVRNFGESKDGEWRNMIVQGDNLQFLKTCYMNQDPMIKDKVKGKVKLVYIDPPFGTGDEYGGTGGEMSYSAKIMGAEFIEGIRERVIFLRELLSDDGLIFIRLDYHFGHYIKVVLDEVFSRNFKNELVINRIYKNVFGESKFIPTATDSIFVYSKKENCSYTNVKTKMVEKRDAFWRHMDDSAGVRNPMERRVFNKVILPPPNKHFKYNQKAIDTMLIEGRIRFKCQKCSYIHDDIAKEWIGCPICGEDSPKLQYLVLEKSLDNLQSNWTDIPGYSSKTGYPTENSEVLLERIITIASKESDLILDCFAGSGTTAAVAEKLGRRWIACDFGKHAIYTMQKRILTIANSDKLNSSSNKKEKYNLPPKPFDVISAGAYDFSRIMNLRQNKGSYISFVLGLFGLSNDKVNEFNKYKLPNIYTLKDGNPVEIYPVWQDEYLKDIRIDEDYLQGIIEASGGRLKGDYYIITPETCTIIGDTILKNSQKEDVHFHMLKFPYKILEDVSRHFQIEEQPCTAADINRLISSTGFYFNEEVKIKTKRQKDGFIIEEFSTNILNANKERFIGLQGLSMILIDFDYDGKIFDMDQAIYARDINDDGFVKVSGLNDKSAIMAIDRHGNESKIERI